MPTFNNGESAASVRTKINDAIEKVDGTQSISSVDINGGTIDGVTIGGASAGAGTFSTATVNGNITVTGTVDGRDVATDGSKLDGIEALADVTDTANVTAAGALMDSELTDISSVKALDQGVATTDSPSFAGLTATTADINGGSIDGTAINTSTIDGTVIGGSTPAAISGTTGQFGTSLNVDGTVTADGLTVNSGSTSTSVTFGNSGTPFANLYNDTNGVAILSADAGNTATAPRLQFNVGGVQTFRIAEGGNISFFENTGTTPKFFWDASTERLGIGNAAPATALDVTGTVKVSEGSSGATANANADGVVIENSGKTGLSILTPNTEAGLIFFADPEDNNIGRIVYDHPTNAMSFITNDSTRLNISSGGDISFYEDTGTTPKFFWDASAERLGLGTSSPTKKLTLAVGNDDGITFGDRVQSGSFGIGLTGGGSFLGNTCSILFDMTGTGSGSVVYRNNTGSHIFQTGDTEHLRITSTGSVGIGTSSVSASSGQKVVELETTQFPTFRVSSTSGTAIKAALSANSVNQYAAIGTDTNHPLIAYTNGTERARIDASGNLLVGTTTAGGTGTTIFRAASLNAGAPGAIHFNGSSTATETCMSFQHNGSVVGSITRSTTTTAYNTSSDYRLKEDVQPMVGASDRVLSLKPCNFAWKVDGTRVDGFLAHEAQAVVPEAVTGEKDGEEMQAIDQSKLVPLLTAALQEALKRIEALEAQLNP